MLAPTLDIGELLQHAPKCIALWLLTFVPAALLLITTPKTSILRWLWFPCFVALAHSLCVELFNATFYAGFRVLCAALTGNALTVAMIMLTIERPGPEDMAQDEVYHVNDNIVKKVAWTCARFYNFRAMGTAWQIKRIPAHPRYLTSRRGPDGQFPLKTYLVRQVLILTWQYLLMDLTFEMSITQPPEESFAMIGDDAEYVYRNLTPEQWQGRVMIGWVSWLTSARAVIDVYYRLTSILVMSLGLSNPDIWPPLFSSVAEVYTIRGFWSYVNSSQFRRALANRCDRTFWHQYLRWPLTSFSNFITRRVLRLPTPSIIER